MTDENDFNFTNNFKETIAEFDNLPISSIADYYRTLSKTEKRSKQSMTDAPKRIWAASDMIAHVTKQEPWELFARYIHEYAYKELALKLLAAEGQACDALGRVAELEVELDAVKTTLKMVEQANSRLRGIIAEMAMYDWSGDRGAPNMPPDRLRKDVAEAIGFPVQPGAPSAGK